jgi:hypothetical protein
MTPEERAQAGRAEASALEPGHIGPGEPLVTGGMSSGQEYDLERWAPLFSSPEAERAHTAATLPASEREAFLASLPPVTDEMRNRPCYGTGTPQAEAGPEAEAQ